MDERTLSFINLYAVLGALTELCRLDEESRQLIADKNVSVGFAVKNGIFKFFIFSKSASLQLYSLSPHSF